MEQNKSPHFIMVFDEEREYVFNIMLQAAFDNPKFVKSIGDAGLLHSFRDFLEDISDKSHELGWCLDPECTYEKHKKEK